MKNLPTIAAFSTLLFSIGCTTPAVQQRSHPSSVMVLHAPQSDEVASFEARALALTNTYRRQHGLPALKTDSQLAHAALRHSKAMAKGGYVGHQEPGVRDSILARVRRSGFQADRACFGNEIDRRVGESDRVFGRDRGKVPNAVFGQYRRRSDRNPVAHGTKPCWALSPFDFTMALTATLCSELNHTRLD